MTIINTVRADVPSPDGANGIDEMPAGREMDALVAERVMGATIIERNTGSNLIFYDYRARKDDKAFTAQKYSTDIAAAWQVVEKVVPGRGISIEAFKKPPLVWHVEFYMGVGWSANDESLPLAICRAALKAVTA